MDHLPGAAPARWPAAHGRAGIQHAPAGGKPGRVRRAGSRLQPHGRRAAGPVRRPGAAGGGKDRPAGRAEPRYRRALRHGGLSQPAQRDRSPLRRLPAPRDAAVRRRGRQHPGARPEQRKAEPDGVGGPVRRAGGIRALHEGGGLLLRRRHAPGRRHRHPGFPAGAAGQGPELPAGGLCQRGGVPHRHAGRGAGVVFPAFPPPA
ncbi:hypothetical protein D9M68_677720 [compost metagenome]